MTTLSQRFYDALLFAGKVHAGQVRKDGTGVPYITHLLAVCALVLDYGGREDEAIAALLHDSVEDQGVSLEVIRADFGDAVADIVAGCTEDEGGWRERKLMFVARMRETDESVKRVVAADKLHNVRSLVRNYREQGQAVWQHFEVQKPLVLWFYRACAEVIGNDTRLGRDLELAVMELEDITEPTVRRSSPRPTGV